VLYGHPPRHFGLTNFQACSVPDLESWLKERELLSRLIQQHLLRAQHCMKNQADKNRTECEFQVGDLVYLKLQSYIQTSVASRGNQKLAFRFFGPFAVLQRIGQVAYKLDLPSDAKIHPVVHVSQLRKHVPPSTSVSNDLSALCTDPATALEPIKFLDSKFVRQGSSTVKLLLVQWNLLPPALAIWEEECD